MKRITILFFLVFGLSFATFEMVRAQASKPANNPTTDVVSEEAPFQSQAEPHIAQQPDNSTAATGETTSVPTTADSVPAQNSNTDPKNFTNAVSLQGLNKITARTSKLEAKIGEPIKFGNLSITLRSCWKSPPEEEPESKALLEMWEEIPGEPRKKVFSGWMFASSPLISAPEHPVYDITLLECTGERGDTGSNTNKNSPEKN